MVRKHTGFSLIEMMITIVILAILASVGVAFTSAWIQKARVHETRTKLIQSFGMAVAIAQRNSTGASLSDAAAGLKLSGQNLIVCSGNPASCTSGSSAQQWKATLPNNTSVSIGGASVDSDQTLSLDNTGAALSSAGYVITNGSVSETGTLQ